MYKIVKAFFFALFTLITAAVVLSITAGFMSLIFVACISYPVYAVISIIAICFIILWVMFFVLGKQ